MVSQLCLLHHLVPPPSTPFSHHLLKCINSSEINSLLYDAVSAYVMIFVQKMGESESGFSFAFGSQLFHSFREMKSEMIFGFTLFEK